MKSAFGQMRPRRASRFETPAAQAPQHEGRVHNILPGGPHPEERAKLASRRARLARAIAPVLVLVALLQTAQAQTPRAPAPARPQAAPATPASPAEQAIPYEPQLLRLAEILGSLSFLRDLCGAGDGDRWRAQMAALIGSEGTTEGRKERLAGAFNKGFRGFEQSYRTCTPNAELVITLYIDEGERIARDVSSRYGGG